MWGCMRRSTIQFYTSPWMKSLSMAIQVKATEQYFRVVMFIMLYNLVLTFESVEEILKSDHSKESY